MSFSADDFAKALEQHDYAFEVGQVVHGKVFSHDPSGAYIDIGGKSAAFIPLAEISLQHVSDVATALPLDEERDFLIVKDQDADGQITLSLRQLEMKKAWQRMLELQDSAQTIQVRVSGINKGGVTVDAQGLRGFIPRSHLLERNDLASLVGKAMTTSFIEVDPERKKLVLSQRLAAQAASLGQLEIGQLIEGTVVGIKPFGLFVDFGEATGLLHINQISKNYVASLSSMFEVGQPIQAMILDIDSVKRRISLSTKLLENYPGEMLENMAEIMSEAAARAQHARKSLVQQGLLRE